MLRKLTKTEFGILFVISFSLFLITFTSAAISLEQQPSQIYNLGDTLNIPLKIVADSPIDNLLSVKLICGTDRKTHV